MKAILHNQFAVVLLSFLCVLSAYGLYAGIVVPRMFARDPQFIQIVEEYDIIDIEESEWKKYVNLMFEEDDWERECKYCFWKDDYIVLFNEYVSQGVQTELRPCTVLFLTGDQKPDEEENPEYLQQLFQQSIILKSSKGAVLDFDAPFSPVAGNKAKFELGRLTGNVSIYSDMKNPGPEDDLEILAGEVVFNEKQIHSSSDIRFKFGRNHGSGKDFYMFLEPSDPKNSKSAKTISGMELHRVNKIFLNTPARQAKKSDSPAVSEEEQFDSFEITCKDIEFSPYPTSNVDWIGRFNQDVDIVRTNTGYDRLTCSRLSVIFAPEPKPGQEPKKNNDLDSLPQLAPLKMFAEGNARVRSPNTNDFLAEGEKIEYDFKANQIILDCGQGARKNVLLSTFGGAQTAVGKRISYVINKSGKFGELIVPDGGMIQGLMSPNAKDAKNQRKFRLEWTDKLQAMPDSDDPSQVRCELFGQMRLHLENLGSLTAKETVIWFNQKNDSKEEESVESSILPFSPNRTRSASKTPSVLPPIFTLALAETPSGDYSHDFFDNIFVDRRFANNSFVNSYFTVPCNEAFNGSTEKIMLGNYVQPRYGNFSAVRWTSGKPAFPADSTTGQQLVQTPQYASRYDLNRPAASSVRSPTHFSGNEPRIAFRTEQPQQSQSQPSGVVQSAPNTMNLAPGISPAPLLLPGSPPQNNVSQPPQRSASPNHAPLSVPVPSINTQPLSLPNSSHLNLPLPEKTSGTPNQAPASVPVNISIGSSTVPPPKTTGSPQSLQSNPLQSREENSLSKGFGALVPERAIIRKDVQFTTENGVCNVRELKIWFYEDEGQFSSYNTTFGEPPTSPNTANQDALQNAPTETIPNNNASANAAPKNRSFFGQQQNGESSQFELNGDAMQVYVKMHGKAMDIEKLHLNGIVSESAPQNTKMITLREINPKQPDSPIKAEGTELRAWNPSSDQSIVQILGMPHAPARFEGMESTMRGLNVIINQQTNQFSIEGPGEITTQQIAMSKNSFSSALSNGSHPNAEQQKTVPPANPPLKKTLVVRWLGRMNFDGLRISFEKEVRAFYPLQELCCNVLNIDLDRKVSFIQQKDDKQNPQNDPEVKVVECRGRVFFVYKEVEDETQSESLLKSVLWGKNFEHVRLFPETGRFFGTAFGMEQGRLNATFRDEGNGIGLGFDLNAPAEERPKTGLSRVDIRFYETITGNFKNFEATASGQVACLYATVPTWDTEIDIDDREKLKAIDGYRLDCDTLEVAKAVDPLSLKEGVELTASGATRIEGKQFFARADSVKFNQIKETVIFQGRGPIKAEIHFQRGMDDDFEDPMLVHQLEYNLRTKKINITGGKGSLLK